MNVPRSKYGNAKDAADQVRAAVAELNAAFTRASELGLMINFNWKTHQPEMQNEAGETVRVAPEGASPRLEIAEVRVEMPL